LTDLRRDPERPDLGRPDLGRPDLGRREAGRRRPSLVQALFRRIALLPGGVQFALALVIVTIVGIADELSGADVAFTLLYLLPVSFAAWFLGSLGGFAIAVASAVAWWAAGVATRSYAPPTSVQVLNFGLQLAVFAWMAALLAVLRDRVTREAALARTDVLTGLFNRRGFLEGGAREIARSARTGRPLTLALIDVDGFKEVNDLRGHEAGDDLLVLLASALRGATRAVDVCARLGGDEFAVLLPETEATSVDAVLDRVRLVLAEAAVENESPVTVSLGAATFSRPPASVDEMMRVADRMLYEVKAAGRNDVRHERVV
jgi:diguanylate cyclase (GGDEF)-like protein